MKQTDHPLIIIDSAINNGQPTIKDTGLTVEFIVEKILIDGTTQWLLLETFPQLTQKTLTAAMHYYRDQLRQENGYPCPCCGYLVFDEAPGSYDICPLCFWEDDSSCLRFPLNIRGPNHVTLIEGQKNYLAFGACEERCKPFVRPPNPGELRDAEWRIIDLERDPFEQFTRSVDYSRTGPKDRCDLYYWRSSYWRRTITNQLSPSTEETT